MLFYIHIYIFLENRDASIFNVIIAIFKQFYEANEFLIEALRILKPDGLLVIYEPLPICKSDETHFTYSERISKLKLSGFKVKDVERESLDQDLESKNLLTKVYNNIEDICKVLANKPPFEVIFYFVM
jgi:SAM-dependent methyltransferase